MVGYCDRCGQEVHYTLIEVYQEAEDMRFLGDELLCDKCYWADWKAKEAAR